MRFFIFALILEVLIMSAFFRAMKRPPPVSRGLKIGHFFSTAVVILLSAQDVRIACSYIMQPWLISADFYVSRGFIPAWLNFFLLITGTTLGTIVCLISSLLVRRLEKGRVIFLRIWPFLILISLIQGVADAQVMVNRMETVNNHTLFAIVAVSFVVMMGGIGWLCHWHFHSASSDALFLKR